MIQHIQESCGFSFIKGDPTILFEDNVACIAHIKEWYIKGDKIKHISPKSFTFINSKRAMKFLFDE